MSGLIVRVAAGVIAAAALSAGVAVGATPALDIEETASADLAVAPPLAVGSLAEPLTGPLSASPSGDALSAPIANQTTTVIPLPPGVVFGLVGLASAAIARRRYLKRR